MTHSRITAVSLFATLILLITLSSIPLHSQQATPVNTAVVPTLVQFSGVLIDVEGKPLSGFVGVTFYLYKEQQGGAPLWIETQNVQPDKLGHYSIMLGSTTGQGLPSDLFASGEARWLGVQVQGQEEQPRVMLLSVPYALKAGDAQTVGGLPPSAFVLAAPPTANSIASGSAPAAQPSSTGSITVTTAGGTVNAVPLWDATSDITSSVITQTGSGSSAKVGINTTTPASTLDIKGGSTVRGTLSLPATKTATATQGYNSQPIKQTASAYNTGTGAAVTQNFQWQAEPTGNDTSDTSGTLNLLFATGSNTPAETGLNIASNGQITFASGQTFPGTGNGTITGVTAGTGLSGGGTSGNVTLNNTGILGITSGTGISLSSGQTPTIAINTSVVPQLSTANTFTGNQTVSGNLSATGVVSGSAYQIGSNLFAYGTPYNSVSNTGGNAFLGFAGNTTTTGIDNTASGYNALVSNTTGGGNTATGELALGGTSTGNYNTAIGLYALQFNTTGNANTAIGYISGLPANESYVFTGSGDSFLGYRSAPSTGSLNNATAIGANAEVSESNALVLGSINGANSATADTYVGIGTTAPTTYLHINHSPATSAGTDVMEITSGGSTAVASLLLQNTGTSGLRLREGAGTGTAYLASSGPLEFVTSDSGTPSGPSAPAIFITDTGNVGIGTSAPDALLSVDGGADKPGGGSWGTFSDRRLKTLDGNFSSGLSQILKINPVRYRYKEENALGIRDHDEHIGLVAQEVQKVIPEAVTENSKGYLLVNNDPIIWAMLNAIKEQQSRALKKDATIRQLHAEVVAQRAAAKIQQAQIVQLMSQIKAQQANAKSQDAQIAALMSQMRAIQSSLKTGLQLRTVKAQVPMVQQ